MTSSSRTTLSRDNLNVSSSGRPTLPHAIEGIFESENILFIRFTTVVLPFVPVTAIVFFFCFGPISDQASSSSSHMGISFLKASLSKAILPGTPGLDMINLMPSSNEISPLVPLSIIISRYLQLFFISGGQFFTILLYISSLSRFRLLSTANIFPPNPISMEAVEIPVIPRPMISIFLHLKKVSGSITIKPLR